MADRKIWGKFIAGVLVTGFLLTSAGFTIARAASDTEAAAGSTAAYKYENCRRDCGAVMQEELAELVAEGMITQKQADQLASLIDDREIQLRENNPWTAENQLGENPLEKREPAVGKNQDDRPAPPDDKVPFPGHKGLQGGPHFNSPLWQDCMNDSLEAGILSEEQVQAIKNYCQEKMLENQQDRMKLHQAQREEQLDKLVEEGTINQQQAAAIMEICGKQQQERQALFDHEDDRTAGERPGLSAGNSQVRAQFKGNKNMGMGKHKAWQPGAENLLPGPWQQLVDDNTLTQEQADIVAQVLRPGFKNQ